MKPSQPTPNTELTERRLDTLASGVRATVRRVESAQEAMQRLMAMGLCAGREVEVVRQGNPLVLGILGARVGVSRRLAQQVIVELHS